MKRLLLCLAIGCGDDPLERVDPELLLGTLSADEIERVCAYGVSLSREVTCNGNPTQSVTTREGCDGLLETISDGCVATVGDLDACFEELAALTDEEVCGFVNPEACDFFGDPTCIDV